MADPIKFSKSKFNEPTARKILAREPKGVTPALVEAASETLLDAARELRFKEPTLNFTDQIKRIASAYPNCMKILLLEMHDLVDDDAVANDFVEVE